MEGWEALSWIGLVCFLRNGRTYNLSFSPLCGFEGLFLTLALGYISGTVFYIVAASVPGKSLLNIERSHPYRWNDSTANTEGRAFIP